MPRAANVLVFALFFEVALGGLGWGLAAWFDEPLAPRLTPSREVWFRGVVATLPMLAALAYATRSRWKPLVDLRNTVERLVGELFAGVNWLGMATIALAAGMGEELLFRGAVQPIAQRWCGPGAGLLVAGLLFGAAHAMTRAYFVFATLVGLYLGWLAHYYGELLTPIVVHASYDFVALIVLRSTARRTCLRADDA